MSRKSSTWWAAAAGTIDPLAPEIASANIRHDREMVPGWLVPVPEGFDKSRSDAELDDLVLRLHIRKFHQEP